MPNTIDDAVKDPDFLKAAVPQQMAYLGAIDPDFKAGKPEEQLAYLNHVTGKAAPTTADNSAEKSSTWKPNAGFTPGNMAGQAWEGLKQMGGAAVGAAKDVLDPRVPVVEGPNSLLHKYVTGPAEAEQQKARTAKTPWESIGHSAAEAIPVVGPWAASLGEQTGTGDVGGAAAKGLTQFGVTEALPKIGEGIGAVNKATKPMQHAAGVGFTPWEQLEKSGQPHIADVRNQPFEETAKAAAPRLQVENQIKPIKSVEDVANASYEAANKLWTGEIAPQIERNATKTINLDSIGQKIGASITPGMRKLFTSEASAADDFANKFQGEVSLKDANDYLKSLNAKLKGYYSKSPEDQAAIGRTSGSVEAMEEAASGLRDAIYKKLEDLGETNPRDLRSQYGSLKQMQKIFEKRAAVVGRQAPLNLPQILGLAGGAGEAAGAVMAGHPVAALGGVAAAAIPYIHKYFNNPDALARRAFEGMPEMEAKRGVVPAQAASSAPATMPTMNVPSAPSSPQQLPLNLTPMGGPTQTQAPTTIGPLETQKPGPSRADQIRQARERAQRIRQASSL